MFAFLPVWLADLISLTALLVTVGGFAFALVQLDKTKSAAEAASAAVSSTSHRLASNQVPLLLQQLHLIEQEVQVMVGAGEWNSVSLRLLAWRRTTTQLAGVLRGVTHDESDQMRESIARSNALATQARSEMQPKDDSPPNPRDLEPLLRSMADTCSLLSELAADMSLRPEPT